MAARERLSFRGPSGARRVAVFAIEDTAAQVTWGALPEGPVELQAGDARVVVEGGPSPGAAMLAPLSPATALTLTVAADGQRARPVCRFRTLTPPPGPLLCRIATVNDLHIGATHFGTLRPFRDPPGSHTTHAERCARAALAEAVHWGAELIVAKGDLTQHGTEAEFAEAADLLAATGIPVLATLGNHDTNRGAADGVPILRSRGLDVAAGGVLHRDVPGLRVIAADSTIPHDHWGRVAHVADDIIGLLADAAAPGLLAMHHYAQRWRYPNTWPPGVPGPEARQFLDELARHHPATLVTSGHTHRHRHHRHGPLHLTEIGSPKDYPGTWAGYAVHEGGIRQVVFRVADPDAIAWTDPTRRVLGGIWGWWSPGPRHHRCFSAAWERP